MKISQTGEVVFAFSVILRTAGIGVIRWRRLSPDRGRRVDDTADSRMQPCPAAKQAKRKTRGNTDTFYENKPRLLVGKLMQTSVTDPGSRSTVGTMFAPQATAIS